MPIEFSHNINSDLYRNKSSSDMNLDLIVVTDLKNTAPGIPPVKSLFINTKALENNSNRYNLIVILEKRLEVQRVIEEIHYLLLKSHGNFVSKYMACP